MIKGFNAYVIKFEAFFDELRQYYYQMFISVDIPAVGRRGPRMSYVNKIQIKMKFQIP